MVGGSWFYPCCTIELWPGGGHPPGTNHRPTSQHTRDSGSRVLLQFYRGAGMDLMVMESEGWEVRTLNQRGACCPQKESHRKAKCAPVVGQAAHRGRSGVGPWTHRHQDVPHHSAPGRCLAAARGIPRQTRDCLLCGGACI